ncbi:tetratricopeptide repeat protein [Aliarcobacter butzleri]|uniref:tetratricopeptide repeat protein n=1 Tax=Aliarcobacter butzleri TaxID=28197 RepID=UPI00244C236C|nr:tetratricopeptide repeat protein [Aliarcobacter butzleri]MDH1975399.1 sel1 repeat family protein [Aliarcobacter butzleri]
MFKFFLIFMIMGVLNLFASDFGVDYFNDGVSKYKNKNYEQAIKLYEQAGKRGNVDAMYNLGVIYSNGVVQQDYKKAFFWFEKASKKGDKKAIYNLGVMYDNGFGVEIDKKKAFNLYVKSASLGVYDAMYNLGMMYINGEGVEKDEKKGKYWIDKSREQY